MKVISHGREWLAEFRGAVTSEIVTPGAQIIVDTIREGILDAPPRSGDVHKDGHGRIHVSSAPGEPPSPSDPYLNSWEAEEAVQEGGKTVSRAVTRMLDAHGGVLGESLEYGDDQAQPRPHVRTRLEEIARRLQARVDQVRGR